MDQRDLQRRYRRRCRHRGIILNDAGVHDLAWIATALVVGAILIVTFARRAFPAGP